MKTKGEKFLKLEEELEPYRMIMSQAADIILDKEVSKYPIFVVHQQEMQMGIPIADKDKVKGNWSINASSLEEFVTKQIIFEERIEEFKNSFKSPDAYLCLFVLSELGAQFIFIPKP